VFFVRNVNKFFFKENPVCFGSPHVYWYNCQSKHNTILCTLCTNLII